MTMSIVMISLMGLALIISGSLVADGTTEKATWTLSEDFTDGI